MCNWICPACGKSDHSGCDVGVVTDMYFPPHFVDGVNVNPDRNWRTSTITCHACGNQFQVSSNGAETTTKWLDR